jgi:hypothetical protein
MKLSVWKISINGSKDAACERLGVSTSKIFLLSKKRPDGAHQVSTIF